MSPSIRCFALLSLLAACGDKGTDPGGGEGDVGSQDTSDPNTASPDIALSSPEDGDVFTTADTIVVEGVASDADEEDASVLSLTWGGIADGTGPLTPLSDGSVGFTLDGLEVGVHTLTVEVRDPQGLSGYLALALVVEEADADGDGYGPDEDCDDDDPSVHPGADEVCNGVDDDCDALVDLDDDDLVDPFMAYADLDADGHGDAATGALVCVLPSGSVLDDTDCDDADPAVNPLADEVCNGIDDDCDGLVDDGDDPVAGAPDWYADLDGDGFGDAASATAACVQPSQTVADATDCDDADAAVNPDAVEVCNGGVDDDCDGDADDADAGVTGTSTWYADADSDGYGDASSTTEACVAPSGTVSDATDCDDTDGAVNPGATEVCNAGTDDDCDGVADDADAGVTGTSTWYTDGDADGYGDAASSADACLTPLGMVSDATDCDDTDGAVNPGATEVCNGGVDDDCDGLADDADSGVTGASTWYTDADLDGFGDAASPQSACLQPSGTSTLDSDCDDTEAGVNPAAMEVCNGGVDDDCDGLADSADSSVSGESDWYADADADSYGDASTSVSQCNAPSGWTADDTDCDDGDAAVNPGATETCNGGVDDDCDGLADDADAAPTGTTTFYADADADGYGDAASTTDACVEPADHVSDATDCDDTDATVNPAAAEVCDADDVDEDCDGVADDDDASATGQTAWYADVDADGYGLTSSAASACDALTGEVAVGGDCDDADGAVHPGADEVCNSGVDDDCDGLADDADGSLSGATTWYTDGDGDGYGDETSGVAACTAPSGSIATGEDCDDSDSGVSPAETEVCGDGVDNDCDGTAGGCGWSGTYMASALATDLLAVGSDPEEMYAVEDQDGDGVAEALVGDLDGGTNGKAWLIEWDGSQLVEVASFLPNSTAEKFGASLASGDVNDDGYPDMVVGDYFDDSGAARGGSTYVWFGPVSGAYIGSSTSDVWYTGDSTYDTMGYASAIVDVDHDGYVDLLSSAADEGHLAVWHGPLTSFSSHQTYTATADTIVYYGAGAEHMERVGDMDGDGFDDLALAGYESSAFSVYTDITTAGYVRAGNEVDGSGRCTSAAAYCSFEVADAGDTNGDGYDDLLAQNGYQSLAREVLLFLGPVTSTATVMASERIVSDAGTYWVSGVDSLGDMDGDGFDDIVYGCQDESTIATYSGAVYLMTGPISGTVYATDYEAKIFGDSAGTKLGWENLGGHDFTGDGADDLLSVAGGQGVYLFEGAGL